VKRFPGLKTLAILILSLLSGACAVDRPPTGGPSDNVPLSIISSFPGPGSVNVSTESIRIEFSHYVTAAELRRVLLFSPSVGNYRLTMHGREAELRLFEPLKPGRTYTLTIGNSLKGFFGNRLEAGWSLPFSTGPTLDRGTLSGAVWTSRLAPASNITILAYATASQGAALSDSLPKAPDYTTRSDGAGRFAFESLADGSYRLVAIDDGNHNLRFDRNKEEFAVTGTSSVATGTREIGLRLSAAESSPASLRSATPINDREIEISFNRPIQARSVEHASITVIDAATGTKLPILAIYGVNRTEEESSFRVVTGDMNPGSTYRVALTAGEAEGTASGLTIRGGSRKPNWPELSVGIVPADKSTDVLLDMVRPDAGNGIELQCNQPVEAASVGKSVMLEAIRKTGSQAIPVAVSRHDDRTWTIRPVDGFEPKVEYRLSVRPAVITTIGGARGRDTLLVSRFTSAGPEQYGELAGSGIARAQSVIVEARRTGTSGIRRTTVRPDTAGGFTFSFRNLPPGSYTVFARVARSAPDAEWNPGSPEPFRPADPFIAVAASVRPGWTTELPALRMPMDTRPAIPTDRKLRKR
jgi:hypothetical protein